MLERERRNLHPILITTTLILVLIIQTGAWLAA
jgi:hypothetical protein